MFEQIQLPLPDYQLEYQKWLQLQKEKDQKQPSSTDNTVIVIDIY